LSGFFFSIIAPQQLQMANKIFSIYKSGKERSTKNNDRITVEIANAHVACIVVGGNSNQIEDFEFFELPSSSIKNFEESFAYVVIGSRLLDKPYADKRVYFNSDQSVLVPAQLYSTENAADYLNVVFGSNNKSEVFKDDLNNQFELVNSYRVPIQVKEVIEKNLAVVTLEHTYSNILKNAFFVLPSLPSNVIKVQFYKSHLIVAVFAEHRLQFIQSLAYTSPDDVLYNLLNLCKQFNLSGLLLQVSGMIDLKSSMYETLSTYFKNITTEDLSVPDIDISNYPAHYFTPFFKLAQ
jgi:hypothetical protein